ncbi:hypothetical protein Ddye_002623 [Dipteronia dyeriana]|uniref:Glutathione peroxidase n=1 Tax=Dipteronia dyeriana TaxID=168575 RepID=A0AAD9XQQ7_9ROSI|nr:hypothetical protein Ddye_002623 [Dipteronia dyeriana]
MPCSASATRLLLFNRNLNFGFLSAYSSSFLLKKHLSTGFGNTLLVSSQNKPLPLLSRPIIKTTVSRPVLLFSSRAEHTMASNSKSGSVYDFTVKDARGNDVDLSIYKGKVLMIVNVASQCGLTNSNYTELSQLYEKYKNQGLEILAFPCNQFGSQEPGSNEEILEFACTRFKAEYPIFDKVDVNGDNAAPLYKHLKSSKAGGGLFGDSIKWNFSKFLVDKQGNVVNRYAPTTTPLSIETIKMTNQLTNNPESVYDFIVKDARDDDVDLSTYKGKVLLIVNVASKCGLTSSNYDELNQLHGKYKDQGQDFELVVLFDVFFSSCIRL